MQTAVGFDPEARCPRWEQAIREWFPDPALAEFVWLAFGYSITGVTTEQALFGGYAGGANGKSTSLRAIANAVGDYAYDMPFSVVELNQRASIPNDLAALAGRRFILASETNDGTRLNEARIKSLTGGDACTARFLHGEYFTFQPVGKIWLAFNHKPVVRDDSFAFWRRVRLIPFVRTFQPDPDTGGHPARGGARYSRVARSWLPGVARAGPVHTAHRHRGHVGLPRRLGSLRPVPG